MNSSAQPIDVSPNNIYALKIEYYKLVEWFEPMSQVVSTFSMKVCVQE